MNDKKFNINESSLAVDINDIAKSTKFNSISLLDGATNVGSQNLTFQVGEGNADTMVVALDAINTGTLFTTDTSGTVGDAASNLGTTSAGNITLTAISSSDRGTLNLSSADNADFRGFITHIDDAISTMNSKTNSIGINQRSLSGKEVNLTEAITANSSARSRIMDTDFAKEQSNSVRLQILQQTATAALSQANMGPQAVLGFLG